MVKYTIGKNVLAMLTYKPQNGIINLSNITGNGGIYVFRQSMYAFRLKSRRMKL